MRFRDAVGGGEVGLHVAEVGSAILREDAAGAPVALTAKVVGAGEQVVAEIVDEQRVASPRSEIERLRRAEIAGRTFPLTGIHQQVVVAALHRDVAGSPHLVAGPVQSCRPRSTSRQHPARSSFGRSADRPASKPGRLGQPVVGGGTCAIVEEKPHERSAA